MHNDASSCSLDYHYAIYSRKLITDKDMDNDIFLDVVGGRDTWQRHRFKDADGQSTGSRHTLHETDIERELYVVNKRFIRS